jgi:hypothetical protein
MGNSKHACQILYDHKSTNDSIKKLDTKFLSAFSPTCNVALLHSYKFSQRLLET